jgi:hypothetical protein
VWSFDVGTVNTEPLVEMAWLIILEYCSILLISYYVLFLFVCL